MNTTENKIKSIYLVSNARICGPINQALNILNGLKINDIIEGRLVTLAPEIEGRSLLNRFIEDNIEIYSLKQSRWKTLFCIPKLRRYLKENDIAILHSSGFRANFVASLMPKKYVKISTQRSSPADIAEKLPKILRPIIRYLYLKLIKRIPNNVACSRSLANIFLKDYGMDIKYVQNGVNSDFFQPLSYTEKIELRKRLNIDTEKKVYLILGSLNKRKNNEKIIRVANRMDSLPFIFLIVGDGPEKEHLKQLATSPNIMFAGSTKDPIKFLQASDVLVSCSLAEGLPNTVLEAMSCGLPCILSDISPHRELLEQSQSGILFDVNDDTALQRAITDYRLWDEAMSKRSRDAVLSFFDRTVTARNYEIIYEDALKNHTEHRRLL